MFGKVIELVGIGVLRTGILLAQGEGFGAKRVKEMMQRSIMAKAMSPMGAACTTSPFKKVGSGHLESQIGDIVKIGNEKYKIMAFPFIDFGSKEHYYLKVPVAIDKYGENSYSMYFDYYTRYVKGRSSCYRYRMSGYPSANNQIFYSENFYFDKNKADKQIDESLSYSNDVFFGTEVVVGKTALSFGIWMGRVGNRVTSEDADYTDDVEWSKLNAKRKLVNNIRKWVKYVEIGKLP